ncbi:mitochondrial 37S ribosomal protein rsm10 [Ptychographa xylographoides]|nr:mitochondrial 37S ribosomal protein rsm10 [Ptychographa xylographoides]
MSLRDPQQKMSKSHKDPRSKILLTDTSDEIHRKIKHALTDSISGISYDPATRPGVSNLLDILSYLDQAGKSPQELANDCSTLTMRAFKELVAGRVADSLAGFRERYEPLIDTAGGSRLSDVAAQGAFQARKNADSVMVRN